MLKRVGVLLLTIFLTVAVVFLFPNFQVGDLSWNGLSFGLPTNLANFKLNQPFGSSLEVSVKADFGSLTIEAEKQAALVRDAQLVRQRLDASGFGSVGVRTQVKGDEYLIVFEFPGYTNRFNAETIAQLASAPGVIRFWSHTPEATEDQLIQSFLLAQISPDYKAAIAQISTSDLNSVAVETRSNLSNGSEFVTGAVWRLRFKQEAETRVLTTIQVQDGNFPAVLAIDDQPGFILNLFTSTSDVLAIPLLYSDSEQLKLLTTYLTVQGSMLGSYGSVVSAEVPAELPLSSLWLVVGAALILSAAFGISSYRRTKKLMEFWSLFAVVVSGLFVSKFVGAELSVSFFVSCVLWLLINWGVYKWKSDMAEFPYTMLRNTFLGIFALVWLLGNSGYVVPEVMTMLNINGMWALVSALMLMVNSYIVWKDKQK